MNTNVLEEPVDLRDYISILKARKVTVIVVLLLVAGAAAALSYRETPVYTATARLLVKPIPISNVGAPPAPNLETEGQVVASEPVAEVVAEELGVEEPPASLLGGLSVTPVTETEVLVISYTSPDAARAQQLANAFGSAYITYRRETAIEALAASQAAVQEQLSTVLQEVESLTQQIVAAQAKGNTVEAASLDAQRGALYGRISLLQQRVDSLAADRSIALGGGELIAPAGLPGRPSSPNHRSDLVVGTLAGIVLGIAAAFVKDRLDERFRSRTDVEELLGVPVMATVPRFPTKKKRKENGALDLVMLNDPRGLASESFRSLATNLRFMTMHDSMHVVLVTSASAEEGKSITTANLAVALAQSGKRVIVVSGDLRRPTIERYFGVERAVGITSLLGGGDLTPAELLHDPGIPNLRLIPSGPLPANPAALLAGPALGRLIEWLRANSDLVLIDSAPALAVADTTILAGNADGVLLIVDISKSHRSALVHVRDEIARTGLRMIGAVINAYDPSSAPYSYYSAYYSADHVIEATDNGIPNEQDASRRSKRRLFSRNR